MLLQAENCFPPSLNQAFQSLTNSRIDSLLPLILYHELLVLGKVSEFTCNTIPRDTDAYWLHSCNRINRVSRGLGPEFVALSTKAIGHKCRAVPQKVTGSLG